MAVRVHLVKFVAIMGGKVARDLVTKPKTVLGRLPYLVRLVLPGRRGQPAAAPRQLDRARWSGSGGSAVASKPPMDDTATPTTDEAKVSPFAPDAPAVEDAADATSDAVVPLRVSEAALHKVLDILSAEDDPSALGLRVEVSGINGAEYAYDVSFEERATTEEVLRYDQGDLGDPGRQRRLWGATLDLPSTPSRAAWSSATRTGPIR